MQLVGKDNCSCGDIRGVISGSHKGHGWSTVSGAFSAISRSECFKWSPIEERRSAYEMTFDFAFQDSRWVLKNVTATMNGQPVGYIGQLFLSLVGNQPGPMTEFSEPQAQALNVVWRGLMQE
jgi:hypothetical protein